MEVALAGIKYDPEDPGCCLLLVFQRWRSKDEDVTWKRIKQVCRDFPDDFSKVKSKLEEYLSSEEAYKKYLDLPDHFDSFLEEAREKYLDNHKGSSGIIVFRERIIIFIVIII